MVKMETLSFGASHNYDTRRLGIMVPVSLSHGGARVELHAKVDSGASACIFAPGHGELLDFDCVVYFAESQSYNRDVLGRQGWLHRIRLGLVDYDGKLYLSDYNDPIS
jgi:hypothetical protein